MPAHRVTGGVVITLAATPWLNGGANVMDKRLQSHALSNLLNHAKRRTARSGIGSELSQTGLQVGQSDAPVLPPDFGPANAAVSSVAG